MTHATPWCMQQGEGGARPGPPPRMGGPLVSPASARRRLQKPTSVASATCEEGEGVWRGGGAWCARGEGGGLWAGWRARARGGGVAVCSAASATVRLTGEEGRPGLAKVGRGARGARGAGGHGQRRGPHPARRGRIPPSIIHGGESWWRRGERHAVPSRPNRTGTGPAGWIPGGRAGLGTGAPGPGSLVVVGRRGGDRAGPWAAAGEGGAWKGRAGSGANPERPPGAGRGHPGAAVP